MAASERVRGPRPSGLCLAGGWSQPEVRVSDARQLEGVVVSRPLANGDDARLVCRRSGSKTSVEEHQREKASD
eukprot:765283-Hanusia_phi.AAC.7